ncbi:MAG TPA: hypothetical protein VH500_05715 [Nitrososphaeraceae archaeon]|jgi:hypothetical protein
MQSISISLFPVESRPYGLSYGEWSVKWWQWLLSVPISSNPAYDASGKYANVNQNDRNVLFLCQTVDGFKVDNASQNRTIFMQAGKSIFMPIINWVSISDVDGQTNEEMISIAKKRMDVVAELEVKIDGVETRTRLKEYRVQSPFFEMILPKENIFQISPGLRRLVADGYWLFIKPLEKDTEITTYASCSSGANRFGISYQIRLI